MVAYVYILRCADDTLYVGSTRDLSRRLWEHQEGLGADYTRRRRPVELAWSAEYPNVGDAFFWEKRVQNWSRAKREALINGEFEALPGLARKQFGRTSASKPGRASAGPVDHIARLRSMTPPVEVVAVTDEFLAQIQASRPGLIHGLYLHGSLCWGEFFEDSDIDFLGVLSRPLRPGDLAALDSAHAHVRESFPGRRYEGPYCQIGDLARPPAQVGPLPVHFDGILDPSGRAGVNPVTWHELAERGIQVRGGRPTVHTDLDGLISFSRENLGTYWEPLHARMADAGDVAVGVDPAAVVWVTLGVARLHHLLARRELTSKSGAGRYILDAMDPTWHKIANEALAIRELPEFVTAYEDPRERGRDVRKFLAWAIDDGLRLD